MISLLKGAKAVEKFMLVDIVTNKVEGAINFVEPGNYLFNSKEEAIDYIFSEGINPCDCIIVSVVDAYTPEIKFVKRS